MKSNCSNNQFGENSMKITSIEYLVLDKSFPFVLVHTDEGITGTGESTNSGGGGALVLAHTYNMMKNDLEGQDFSEGLIGENPSNQQKFERFFTRTYSLSP